VCNSPRASRAETTKCRAPCSCPQRIDGDSVDLLRELHPLYVNLHFNHPDEFLPDSIRAMNLLADSGFPLGNQTVLLKGVNDSVDAIKRLCYTCVDNRVKPYYLAQCDEVQGTEHFWTDYQKMFEIAQGLIGNITGFAIPNFIIDCRGGLGKVRLLPEHVVHKNRDSITLKTFRGQTYIFRNLGSRRKETQPHVNMENLSKIE
jgi:lysine 2,3-aminomutase